MMMAGVVVEGWGMKSADRALLNAQATLRLVLLVAVGIACWRLAGLPLVDGAALGMHGGTPWLVAFMLALFGQYRLRGLRRSMERGAHFGPMWPFWAMAGFGAFVGVAAELLFLTVLFEVHQARTALALVPAMRRQQSAR